MSDFNAVEKMIEEIKRALNAKNIHELRQIGRAVGVFRPTDAKRENLLNDILLIAQNKKNPIVPNKRGAPAKSKDYDKLIVEKVLYCRDVCSGAVSLNSAPNMLEVNTNVEEVKAENGIVCGYLQIIDNRALLRTINCYITPEIANDIVKEYNLRSGDKLSVKIVKNKNGVGYSAVSVVAVNGIRPDMFKNRPNFESFTPCYGDKVYNISSVENNLTTRLIDLFAPIANGARALVCAPQKSGKTELLKTLAKAIKKAKSETEVIFVAIDERPEEMTEILEELGGVEVIYSTFETSEQNHVNTAILANERAKRLVEEGKEVVLVFNDLTRLVKACNVQINERAALNGELSVNAFSQAKKLFGSARNLKGGTSLTVIASCEMQAERAVDDVFYHQFKDAANTVIMLNKSLSESKLFPAIDIKLSGTRKEDTLLTNEEIELSIKLKRLLDGGKSYSYIHSLFNSTKSNAELIINVEKLIGDIK